MCQAFQNQWLGSWSPRKPLHLWLPSTTAPLFILIPNSRLNVPHWRYWILKSNHHLQCSLNKRGIPGWDTDVWGREVLSSTLQATSRSCLVSSHSYVASVFTDPQTREENESLTAHMGLISRANTWLVSLSRPGWKENKLLSYELEKGTVQFFIDFTFDVFRHKNLRKKNMGDSLSIISILWIFM